MVLEQLHAGFAEVVVLIDQFFADVAAQIIAVGFEGFDRAKFLFVGHGESVYHRMFTIITIIVMIGTQKSNLL
jgi:hypothetical protein